MDYKEIINNPEYEEIASVKYDDIKEFVTNEIPDNQGWARVANMYQLLGIFLVILGLFKAFMPFYAARNVSFLISFGLGIVFTFTVLIILHELIHAIAYKFIGVKKISFGMNLRKFLFYVQADGSVINYKQLKIVALAPPVVITVISFIIMAIWYESHIFFFLIPVVGIHSFFSSGDFGLLCFFQNRPDRDILMFDIKEEGKTYFYAKKQEVKPSQELTEEDQIDI